MSDSTPGRSPGGRVMTVPEPPKSGLPIIERPLDNTAISAYMTCPTEYMYGMLMHRRAGGGLSEALEYGSAWHKVMEYHYRTNGNVAMVEQMAKKRGVNHGNPNDHRTLGRLLQDYRGYRKKWGERPSSENAKTVGYPHAPLVEISAELHPEGLVHPYAVKIDRIVELDGLYYVEDHKTTSRLDKHFFTQFSLSAQMMGYTYCAKHLFPQLKIVGVRINVLHLLKDSSNYERHIETYTPDQLEGWAANANGWMRRIAADTEAGYFPMHFGDNGCSRKFGMCQYHRVCSASPRLRDRILTTEFTVNPWNPLELDED